MAKIFIVRSVAGEMMATDLAGLRVVFAFEEKSLADSYCAQLSANNKSHKVESIAETEFHQHLIPNLRSAQVNAIVFNLLPGETAGPDVYCIDISRPANPRTFDFKLGRWLTAKDSRQLRKIPKATPS